MGCGQWTKADFERYSAKMGRLMTASGDLDSRYNDRQLFKQPCLHPGLDPRDVMRECCDSDDHPETIPVILALDVTGSMGPASAQVAKKLNQVMTKLYDQVKDVEFMVMGIGDLAYDRAPIQISQFESDIRIAEQLDQVYMEHGGGGNAYESYTAAWYMGLNHTKLDCWKRGKKGLIITMGDEPLNPYLPVGALSAVTGDPLQADVETAVLYRETVEKYDVWHLHVNHRSIDSYWPQVQSSFGKYLKGQHLMRVTVDSIADAIISIVKEHAENGAPAPAATEVREISWDTEPKPRELPPDDRAPQGNKDRKEKRKLFGVFSW